MRSGEVDLAVQVRGTSGPVVVLVHGYPDTHAVWDRVAALLEAVNHGVDSAVSTDV